MTRGDRSPLWAFAALLPLASCQPAKTPQPTARDVEDARQQAARELSQARVEASKDVHSAQKIAGSGSREARQAKATASYDIAMAKADGDHEIATVNCLTLTEPMLQACREHADGDYEAAKAAAKLMRTVRE
jgi:hypothetical protein